MLVQKIKASVVGAVVFTLVSLHSHPIIASNNVSDSGGSGGGFGTYATAAVAGGIGIGAAILAFVLKNSKEHDWSFQAPVVLSSSNHNLLSTPTVNGGTATGTINVLNTGSHEARKFSIMASAVDSNGKPVSVPVSIDPNSSCYGPTPAGGQCQFNVSYNAGSWDTKDDKGKPIANRTTVYFNVGDDLNTSDFHVVSAVAMPSNVFFRPIIDATEAKGLPNVYTTSFATINKNGVDILYVGTLGNGVFRSTDGGDTWTPINAGLTPAALNVNVLKVINNILYAGTQDGVFKSVNGGYSWACSGTIEVPVPQGGNVVWIKQNKNVVTLCSMNGILYAGVAYLVQSQDDWMQYRWDGAIFVSTDMGNSWGIKGVVPSSIGLYTLYPINNALYIVSQNLGVLMSTDEGGSWATMNTGLPANIVANVLCLRGDTLYVGTDKGVYAKASWTEHWLHTGLKKGSITSLYLVNNELYAGSNDSGKKDSGIFKSVNEGENWTAMNNGLPSSLNVDNLYAVNNVLYTEIGDVRQGMLDSKGFTNGVGVFKSLDGGDNWQPVNNEQMANLAVNTLYSANNILYAGTNNIGGGVAFKTVDGGGNWGQIKTGSKPGIGVDALYSVDNTIYVGDASGVSHTSDGGNNWTKPKLNEVNSFLFLKDKNKLLAGTANGVRFSNDKGDSWTGDVDLDSSIISALYSTGEVNYAGTTSRDKDGSGTGIYESKENKIHNWASIKNVNHGDIVGFCATNTALYTAIYNVIYSPNKKGKWQPISNPTWNPGDPDISFTSLASASNALYVGGYGGRVFKTINNGSSWDTYYIISYGSDMPPVSALYETDDAVYAGTSSGIYKMYTSN